MRCDAETVPVSFRCRWIAALRVSLPLLSVHVLNAQQACPVATPEARAAVHRVLQSRDTTSLRVYGIGGVSLESLVPLHDSSDAAQCRKFARAFAWPALLWRIGSRILLSEAMPTRDSTTGTIQHRSRPMVFVYNDSAGTFRYLEGQAPPLRGPFARFIPDALRRAITCDPPDFARDSLGVPQRPGLFCSGSAFPTLRGEPYLAMISLDADGEILHMSLHWEVGSLGSEDTVRTAVLDSAYAAAESVLVRLVGARMACAHVPVWSTQDGIAILTPPQRGRSRGAWGAGAVRYPQHARWVLYAQRGLFHQCPAIPERKP